MSSHLRACAAGRHEILAGRAPFRPDWHRHDQCAQRLKFSAAAALANLAQSRVEP